MKVALHFSAGYGSTMVVPSRRGRSILHYPPVAVESPRTNRFYRPLRDAPLFFRRPHPPRRTGLRSFSPSGTHPSRTWLNTYPAPAGPKRPSRARHYRSPTSFSMRLSPARETSILPHRPLRRPPEIESDIRARAAEGRARSILR
jgi:hypothetical protein